MSDRSETTEPRIKGANTKPMSRKCLTCGAAMNIETNADPPPGTARDGANLPPIRHGEFYYCPHGCPIYELEHLSADGTAFAITITELPSDASAMEAAREASRQWPVPFGSDTVPSKNHPAIRVLRVPYINNTSIATCDIWPDRMKLIGEISASEDDG